MSTNLLQNPNFERGFRNVNNIGELTVAEDWYPWFVEGGQSESKRPFHRPEYKPEVPNVGSGRVLEGAKAQKQFTTYSPMFGGVYQQIAATPGKWYKLTAWGYAWSSSKDDPNRSDQPWGKLSMLAGINPWGRTDMQHRTTVWGKEIMDQYNDWYMVEVIAQAWAPTITAALGGIAEHAVKHNDVYWDKAELVEFELGSTPQPEPEPTPDPGNVREVARQVAIEVLREAAASVT